MVGETISHYRITDKLGEGGMGVVYRAEDTRLDRTVALKFLASHLLEDDEARKRFVREAKAAAALDHPNICTIHEIDEVDGHTFLAMAFVDGASLKDRIAERPLKLDEAIDLAIQIADGLSAAHEAGVVHRDIKPGNILINKRGQVKILDFGLAHLGAGTRITQTGTMIGTPAYMPPEQVRGEQVDRRADVWSLGVLLYEAVTGRLPFPGDSAQTVALLIQNETPEPPTAVRSGVPRELDRIVGKALAKDPGERYQHIDEALVDLRALRKRLPENSVTRTAALPAAAGKRYWLPWLAAAAAAASALALAFVHFLQPPETPQVPLVKFGITAPLAGGASLTGTHPNDGISPDGRHIVFTSGAERSLWTYDLARGGARVLEGTEGADDPFWSPDSQFIGFFRGREILKIPAQGGAPTRVYLPAGAAVGGEVDGNLQGGSWSPDGSSIVFSASGSLYEVQARGGPATLLVSPEESAESSVGPTGLIRWPHFLPSEAGPRVLVYTFGSGSGRNMMVHDLESGRRELLGSGELPFYSPTGHLLYQAGSATYELWALPFSLGQLRATGEPFLVSYDARHPTVSVGGTLTFVSFPVPGSERLVWLNRDGEKIGETGVNGPEIRLPELSPDERSVALQAADQENTTVWAYEVDRGTRNRISIGPGLYCGPVWSADGTWVAFSSPEAGNRDLIVKPADGSGEEEAVAATPRDEDVSDWSRDGRYILFDTGPDPETGWDLWYLERTKDSDGWEAHPFLATPASEGLPMLSPDGRYVAYVSSDSGRDEVYVQPFPEGGRRVTVSTNGGSGHRWSQDGKELFYVEGGDTLMAVEVSTAGEFSVGPPTRLFQHLELRFNGYPRYDVSRDGRFLVVEPVGGDAFEPEIRVVQNWYAEFRDRQ